MNQTGTILQSSYCSNVRLFHISARLLAGLFLKSSSKQKLGGFCVCDCTYYRLWRFYFNVLYSLTDIIVLAGDWPDQVIGHICGGVQGTG